MEDNLNGYLLIEELLKNTKIKFLHAKNGAQALEFCEKNKDVDLALVDIQLPDIDGLQLTRKLKLLRPIMPVIALTAYSLPESRDECLKVGCNDYFSKPFNASELLMTLNKYLLN